VAAVSLGMEAETEEMIQLKIIDETKLEKVYNISYIYFIDN
jgi:hypothetical protein